LNALKTTENVKKNQRNERIAQLTWGCAIFVRKLMLEKFSFNSSVFNAPPPFAGHEWAELPNSYFAVQTGSCQPDLVAATRFLYLLSVENICTTVYSHCFL
jgi:hypothetical protein